MYDVQHGALVANTLAGEKKKISQGAFLTVRFRVCKTVGINGCSFTKILYIIKTCWRDFSFIRSKFLIEALFFLLYYNKNAVKIP